MPADIPLGRAQAGSAQGDQSDGAGEKKKRMAFYLSEAQIEKVRVMAYKNGVTQSVVAGDLIDKAIKALLPRTKQPIDDSIQKERVAFWLTARQREKVETFAFDLKLNNTAVMGYLIDQAPDPGISRG